MFENLSADWLQYKEKTEGRAVATVDKYAKTLDRLGKYCQGLGLDPLGITAGELEQFAGLELHRQKIGARGRRPMVSALRGFYGWLHASGAIRSNPAELLPLPSAGAPLPAALSLDNAERLLMQPGLDSFLGVRDSALLALLIGTGARISGLARLNDSDLHWVDVDGRERLLVKLTEKGNKQRLLPVPDEARLLVRAYLGHPDLGTIDRTLADGDRVLWCSINNRQITDDKYHGEARRLSTRSIDRIIKHHGQAAGIPTDQLHAHAARHLVGIELQEDETNLLTMQTLLGHSDPKSTRIYTRMAARQLAKVVDQSNPLRKINTPVSALIKSMDKSTHKPASFGSG